MPPAYLPLIAKARIQGLTINVARSGLILGDQVDLVPLEDGRLGAMARVRARFLGLFPRGRQTRLIGHFGAEAAHLLTDGLAHAAGHPDGLRLRIVGLTPEFMAGKSGPEVHVSVWMRV